MTEAQVGFLYSIAAAISKSKNDGLNIMKSYYLMRCKQITRGYGLPDKYFSTNIRCPKCCIEWKKDTEVKVRPINLSKRQKKRLRSKEVTQSRKEFVRSRKDLLISNELEQVCSFCKKKTITPVLKPQKQRKSTSATLNETEIFKESTNKQKYNQKNKAPKTKKKEITNVYANALDIFSMQNKQNVIASTIKEKPKLVTNNKRKKDKFAGLCQKAVLASKKLKECNDKQNMLNLFLKPSK